MLKKFVLLYITNRERKSRSERAKGRTEEEMFVFLYVTDYCLCGLQLIPSLSSFARVDRSSSKVVGGGLVPFDECMNRWKEICRRPSQSDYARGRAQRMAVHYTLLTAVGFASSAMSGFPPLNCLV